jgi:hypothetical protein
MKTNAVNPVMAALIKARNAEKAKLTVWAERKASKSSVYYTVFYGEFGTERKTIVGGATTLDNLKYKMRCAKTKFGIDPNTKHTVVNIKKGVRQPLVTKSAETSSKKSTPMVKRTSVDVGKTKFKPVNASDFILDKGAY